MAPRMDNQIWDKYVEATVNGAVRGLLGLPLEHPFDCIKTCWQANPHWPSAAKVTRHIYQSKGMWGFYAGAVPNGTRMVVKQAYRFPMMIFLPEFFSEKLPHGVKQTIPYAEEASTAVSIATFETGIVTPLERLKVEIMTSQKAKRNILRFIAEHRDRLLREAYRGFKACYVRQLVTWPSFSVSDAFFKAKARELTHKTARDPLRFPELMMVATSVGIVNTAAVMPFDFVKTQLQKKDAIAKGIIAIMRDAMKEKGISTLYTGWRVKMVHYILHSAYTVTWLDRLKVRTKSG